ncbi:hypothetical protein J6590_012195 [Homalodisca vitripennis]|nr:hypothetical protein J6590_012195 [Homalodisca vitripennis]
MKYSTTLHWLPDRDKRLKPTQKTPVLFGPSVVKNRIHNGGRKTDFNGSYTTGRASERVGGSNNTGSVAGHAGSICLQPVKLRVSVHKEKRDPKKGLIRDKRAIRFFSAGDNLARSPICGLVDCLAPWSADHHLHRALGTLSK